jgi:hypothetical protein
VARWSCDGRGEREGEGGEYVRPESGDFFLPECTYEREVRECNKTPSRLTDGLIDRAADGLIDRSQIICEQGLEKPWHIRVWRVEPSQASGEIRSDLGPASSGPASFGSYDRAPAGNHFHPERYKNSHLSRCLLAAPQRVPGEFSPLSWES